LLREQQKNQLRTLDKIRFFLTLVKTLPLLVLLVLQPRGLSLG
jgi:hypothetical protein